MKDQYVGGINDYRKYALLRALSSEGSIRLGVCWMLTPADGRTDGRMTEYLRQPVRWRHYDPELFDLLAAVIGESGARRLRSIESSAVLPRATYFNEIVPDDRQGREGYFARASEILRGCDLIFFDPDNGLDISSKRKGQKGSSKFVYRDEIASTFAAGHSVLIYQHFPRETRSTFLQRLAASLTRVAASNSTWAFRTANVAFILLIHPKHTERLGAAAVGARKHVGDLFGEIGEVGKDPQAIDP